MLVGLFARRCARATRKNLRPSLHSLQPLPSPRTHEEEEWTQTVAKGHHRGDWARSLEPCSERFILSEQGALSFQPLATKELRAEGSSCKRGQLFCTALWEKRSGRHGCGEQHRPYTKQRAFQETPTSSPRMTPAFPLCAQAWERKRGRRRSERAAQ